MALLSTEEAARYKQDGWVRPQFRLPEAQVAHMRQALDDDDAEHAASAPDLLARFGADGPDGIRLAVVSKIEKPSPG